MTVNKYLMPIIAIAALIAVVLGARLTGDWIVSGKQIPLGDMTAADIKGWMTLQNVSDGLQIPLPDLYKLAGIPEGAAVPPTTAMKDLEGLVEGFEISLLREAAAAYLGGGALQPRRQRPNLRHRRLRRLRRSSQLPQRPPHLRQPSRPLPKRP